jgi:hypothetical protein
VLLGEKGHELDWIVVSKDSELHVEQMLAKVEDKGRRKGRKREGRGKHQLDRGEDADEVCEGGPDG